MISVVIADDQVLLRESIGYILDNDEEIEVVGMVGDGRDIINLCEQLKPDIILMDIEMPEINGVKATKIIKEKHSHTKVIMLTTFENTENIMESFIVKADGYILKTISYKDLVLTIKCVHSGLTVIHDSVREIMVDRFKGLHEYKTKYQDILNEKDIKYVRLIANGKSNKEIASVLNYSEGTVKNYVSKLLDKLNMSDRIQIAIFAIDNGIV